MALSYWSYLWDGSTGFTSKHHRTKKSAWRNLINLWRTSGWAVIFADFNAPLRLIHFGKKALLPGVTRIAHRQARSLCPARAAKFRSHLLHGSIHFRISHAADPDHAWPNWMARSEPILRRFHSRVLNLVGKQAHEFPRRGTLRRVKNIRHVKEQRRIVGDQRLATLDFFCSVLGDRRPGLDESKRRIIVPRIDSVPSDSGNDQKRHREANPYMRGLICPYRHSDGKQDPRRNQKQTPGE